MQCQSQNPECRRFHFSFLEGGFDPHGFVKKFKNMQESATATETKRVPSRVSTFCVTSIHLHGLCDLIVYMLNSEISFAGFKRLTL